MARTTVRVEGRASGVVRREVPSVSKGALARRGLARPVGVRAALFGALLRARRGACEGWARVRRLTRGAVREEQGQGTTEYAILVGVLVVIAIVAIIAFRGKIQELWNAIASSINGL